MDEMNLEEIFKENVLQLDTLFKDFSSKQLFKKVSSTGNRRKIQILIRSGIFHYLMEKYQSELEEEEHREIQGEKFLNYLGLSLSERQNRRNSNHFLLFDKKKESTRYAGRPPISLSPISLKGEYKNKREEVVERIKESQELKEMSLMSLKKILLFLLYLRDHEKEGRFAITFFKEELKQGYIAFANFIKEKKPALFEEKSVFIDFAAFNYENFKDAVSPLDRKKINSLIKDLESQPLRAFYSIFDSPYFNT
ncbi:MAG: hypothetical protein WC595_00905 [Candidatus Nanoarchaeia archaeon]